MTTAAPDAVMHASGASGADFVQPVDAVAIKAELRRVARKRGVLAIRAVPRWEDDPPLVVAGQQIRVVPCATVLAVRDALTLRNDPDRPLVILTDLSVDQLGDGICDHLVARKPLLPDPWLSLRDRFGAEQQEADLLSGRESARDALRLLGDFPVLPAPGGVLTRDHLIRALTVQLFGLGDNGFTIVDVLVWSTDAGHTRRFREWLGGSTPELAGDVFGWFARTLGAPAAAIIAAWRHRDPADLLPLGLVAGVLEGQGGPDDHDAAVALRARIEDAIGRVPLTEVALTGWARSATLAADRIASGREPDRARFTAVQRRADALATELLVGAFCERSDHLPSALDHRLELFAVAAENAVGPRTPRRRCGGVRSGPGRDGRRRIGLESHPGTRVRRLHPRGRLVPRHRSGASGSPAIAVQHRSRSGSGSTGRPGLSNFLVPGYRLLGGRRGQ